MQYVFFENGMRSVHRGLRQGPKRWENFREFLYKINLTDCKVTVNCISYRKMGEFLPQQFCWGSNCSPGSRAYGGKGTRETRKGREGRSHTGT